jgi:hypothetical protein
MGKKKEPSQSSQRVHGNEEAWLGAKSPVEMEQEDQNSARLVPY